ncbi:hypothetical protein HYW84_03075 [Candidatus Peregrinibacteria bacterium]|nr:hypothetical protein [Candidatus Peregrinibacteria bacterium]
MSSVYEQQSNGAKGSDGASPTDKQKQIDHLRDKGIRQFRRLAESTPNVLSRKDEELHLEDSSNSGMERWGHVTENQKIKFLKDLLDNIRELEHRAPHLERKFRSQIENAIAQKWIGRRSVARWMQRLAADNAYYWQKETFINDSEKFPKFLRNWEKVATGRKQLLGNPMIKKLSSGDVKNLNIFLNEENFLNRPFEEREGLVAAVRAALAAKERQMPQLHAKAKYMLEGAARDKALSWSKVGVWMQRIFTGGANAELIEQFINGAGATIDCKKMTLTRLIANWSEASAHFRVIENKRRQKGTPRGFHFVKLEVFLNWRFEQRKSYLSEAENSFEDIRGQDELALKIRHELAAQDWESAEDLLQYAASKPVTQEQKDKLDSLRKFLREHQNRADRPVAGAIPETPQELRREMSALLAQIPSSMRPFYEEALRYDDYQTIWALMTIVFNRIWCYQHNFLDDQKEKTLERKAKEETRVYVRRGHKRRGHEAVNVKDDTNTEAAVRYQAGIKGALFQFVRKESAPTQIRQVHKQANIKDYWYWASLIPEGVPYAEQLNIVQNIHPRMKKLARAMHNMHVRYHEDALSGDGAAAMLPAGRAARMPLPSLN